MAQLGMAMDARKQPRHAIFIIKFNNFKAALNHSNITFTLLIVASYMISNRLHIIMYMHGTSDIVHIWVLDIMLEVRCLISYQKSDIILEVRYHIGSQIYISDVR